MKIIPQSEALAVSKPEGINVRYYLRDEYELHYNEQAPGVTQTWHHHEKIFESLFILEGELVAEWKVGDKIERRTVKAGDLIETENTPHSFSNQTDKIVKFLVLKQVLSGINKSEIFKTDKVVD